jgi:hypothetical protein
MKTFDFIQATVSHNLKNPYSKALEPDRLFPFARHYDTVSPGGEKVIFLTGAKAKVSLKVISVFRLKNGIQSVKNLLSSFVNRFRGEKR